MSSLPPPSEPTPQTPGPKKEERFRQGVRHLNAASLGWNFVTAPLVGGAMGYGVDWLLGSYPWSMIVGLFLGFAGAFIDLIRSVR